MTQTFVRYGPDVEQNEPDFEQTLQQVLDDMKEHMRGSLKTEGIGLMVRNAHAKGYGLARGEFEILSGMPNEYAQGIYAKPGRHEAMVRFSNGTNHVGSDRFLGPIVFGSSKVPTASNAPCDLASYKYSCTPGTAGIDSPVAAGGRTPA